MALVVDTDVVSFLYKRDTRAELYRPHLNDPPFIISFMTLAELRSWMRHRHRGPTRRQRLERYLQRYQLIYANDELCEFWAQATDSARRNGRPIGSADAWIAATAQTERTQLTLKGGPTTRHHRRVWQKPRRNGLAPSGPGQGVGDQPRA